MMMAIHPQFYVPQGPQGFVQDQPSRRMFEELIDYTQAVAKRLNILWDAKGKRNWKEWDAGYPTGWCTHFTASNMAVSKDRPLGRIPTLFQRFARNSGTPGIHFIAWDSFVPQFEDLRKNYTVFNYLPCDVWCWGLDKAFYHGNALNGFCTGLELRNLGRLIDMGGGKFGWGDKNNPTPYVGRDPIKMRNMGWYEPFTQEQVTAVIMLCRWLKNIYPIEPMKYLGHLHVTSNRTDPFPHFPLQMTREAVFFDREDVRRMDWLMSYKSDPKFWERNDEYMEEVVVEDTDPMDVWARDGGDIELQEEQPYGADGVITVGDIVEAKKALYQLGYYPFVWNPAFTAGSTVEFVWTLKMFQRRWVKMVNDKPVQLIADTGIVDKPTAQKLTDMLRQYDLIPDR